MSSEQDRVMIRDGDYMKSRPVDVDRSTAMIARMLPSARLALAGILALLSALPAGIAPAAAEAATTFRWVGRRFSGPVITPGPKAGARASPDRSATTREKPRTPYSGFPRKSGRGTAAVGNHICHLWRLLGAEET